MKEYIGCDSQRSLGFGKTTPFHYAVSQGYYEITEELLKNNRDLPLKKNGAGKTPFDVLCDSDFSEEQKEKMFALLKKCSKSE